MFLVFLCYKYVSEDLGRAASRSSSPQSPMLKLLASLLMNASPPQADTLMKNSAESLMVKPKVNRSISISVIRGETDLIGALGL